MPKFDFSEWQQLLALMAFVAAISTTFYACAGIIAVQLISRLRRQMPPALSAKNKVVLVIGAIGAVCVLYGFFVEPYWLSVTNVSIKSPKIHSAKPLRIVHISDLHCDPQPRLEDKLPDVIAELKPDIIAFTGDSINSPQGLPVFRRCLTRLAKIAPTFVVKGNWDSGFFRELDRFGGTGATELTGHPVKVRTADTEFWISGLPVGTTKTVADAIHGVPPDAFNVFLFHYPDYIEEMSRSNVDLYLAGHTHGGQVALPFYGAIITLAATGKRYEAGLYSHKLTHLYVNRGIGMEGGIAPRVRFCASPEVTVIDVYGEGSRK